nr:hypothetical protein [Candidatus Phytoplasma sacchari]KAB8121922.1 hypothetical protein F2B49_01980 [Candidatus Phytoplasma sacchari]
MIVIKSLFSFYEKVQYLLDKEFCLTQIKILWFKFDDYKNKKYFYLTFFIRFIFLINFLSLCGIIYFCHLYLNEQSQKLLYQ